jgi:hypothetical protein
VGQFRQRPCDPHFLARRVGTDAEVEAQPLRIS